jgi:hypothetical protein
LLPVQLRQPPFFPQSRHILCLSKETSKHSGNHRKGEKAKNKKRNNKPGTLMLQGILEGTSTNISDPHGWQPASSLKR